MAKETMNKQGTRKGTAHRSTSTHSAAPGKRKTSSRKKKAARKRKRILIFSVELVALVLLLCGFWVVRKLDMIQKPEPQKEETKPIENLNTQTAESMSGFTNVALFGLDTRISGQLGKGNRSDTIIIASINNDTKEAKLVSVYRDTYLDMRNGKYHKANNAYAAGGPDQARMMLNANLDLDIEYYISVDFAALTETVDLMGGIMIDVDESEIGHLNNYTEETSEVTGVETTKLTKTGYQLLDGVQATSYCRIRYTNGDDYKRTERQREVIMEIVSKAKEVDISKINDIINAVFPKIATNYTNSQLLNLAPQMLGYDIVDTVGFPFEKETMKIKGVGDCVIPVNLEQNVIELHEYLFGNTDYVPSSEVHNIALKIINDTGIGEMTEDSGQQSQETGTGTAQ